jgi:uncharacterized protein YcfJ
MKFVKAFAGVAVVAALATGVQADSRYYDRNDRHYDPVEVFYVEGRVVSAQPIYESTWYYRSRGEDRRDSYRETCRIRDVEVYRSHSSAGPAGAIIGGAIGAHVGANAGRSTESAVVGAIAGGVIGSVIGSEIDRDHTTVHYRYERDCDTRYHHEHRVLVGYDVRYRYNGREFSIQTDEHPGRYIQLRVEVQPTVR